MAVFVFITQIFTLADSTELLCMGERSQRELIQIASHELRTPLTAVRGFLALLQMDKYGKLTPKQREFIQKAVLASGRLSRLIDELLILSRMEQNKINLSLEKINVDELVNLAAQELAGEADRCNIALRILMPSDKLPEITADREKMFHVITNLIANAIKYSPKGGHVFIEPKVRDGKLEISVSDTGVGIAQEDFQKLFQKFERLKNKDTRQINGTGLGLVIVKSFMELHGGGVSVNSRVGQGSTFTVSLPLSGSPQA